MTAYLRHLDQFVLENCYDLWGFRVNHKLWICCSLFCQVVGNYSLVISAKIQTKYN